MGEVEGQRYLCKICNKSCVSGKSLGGHMRVHLSQIAASKKAKTEIKMEFNGCDDQDGSIQLKESSKNQSNSAQRIEEKVKDWEKTMDSGNGDQNNSYELRENPKKSWRISNSKQGVMKNGASCKECRKEFPSLRALAGHMRSHSIKNKKLHLCKTCGKGFDSMRAMFGHMKSHSKRLRVPDDSADSLSDLENLCPVRQKRSRIRYKSTSNPSCSSLNGSNCDVCEVEDAEEVAMSLMMLSRGVKNWIKFDSVQESESSGNDDGSVYFGGESSCKSKKSGVDDDDFVCDVYKTMEMSLSTGNLEKNVCESDDLDVEDEMKVDLQVSDDQQSSVGKLLKSEPSNEFAVQLDCAHDSRSSDLTKFAEFSKSNSCKMGSSYFHESDSGKNLSEKEVNDVEILEDFEDKNFQSHSMSGGRKMQGDSIHSSCLSVGEADPKLDQIECGDNQLEQESFGVGTVNLELSEKKEHRCPICFKVFLSGRALGGHKRAHYTGCNESKIEENAAANQEFDLNFPVAIDEGPKSEDGLNLWWAQRNREQEALVLTS